jgi:hypothetical protein
MVWQGVITGEVEFPDGKKMLLSPMDWKDFVKWIYGHIDGPPRAEIDVTSLGERIKGYTILANPDMWDEKKDGDA